MPAVRKRVTKSGGPAPCVVRVPAPLAAFLYREVGSGRFTSETELVTAIVREWVRLKKLPPVDWPAVAAGLREPEASSEHTRRP